MEGIGGNMASKVGECAETFSCKKLWVSGVPQNARERT